MEIKERTVCTNVLKLLEGYKAGYKFYEKYTCIYIYMKDISARIQLTSGGEVAYEEENWGMEVEMKVRLAFLYQILCIALKYPFQLLNLS